MDVPIEKVEFSKKSEKSLKKKLDLGVRKELEKWLDKKKNKKLLTAKQGKEGKPSTIKVCLNSQELRLIGKIKKDRIFEVDFIKPRGSKSYPKKIK